MALVDRIRVLAPAAAALLAALALMMGSASAGSAQAGTKRQRHRGAAACARIAHPHALHSRRARARARRCAALRSHRRHRRHGAAHSHAGRRRTSANARAPRTPTGTQRALGTSADGSAPGSGSAPSSTPTDGTGCEGTSLMPSTANVSLIAAATLCLVNRERTARGERPLSANTDLTRAAQGHTISMTRGGYFEHESPYGQTMLQRIESSGYIPGPNVGYELGENIAWGSLGNATPAAIVAAWMASRGHRENILNPNYRDSGMGVSPDLPTSFAGGQAGAIYTQDFGAILTG